MSFPSTLSSSKCSTTNFEGPRSRLEESRSRYLDLYENAPVGYLTFSEKGILIDINLTATHLLGIDRAFLLNKPFSALIDPESQDIFFVHRRRVLASLGKHTCELTLRRNNRGQEFFPAQIESIAVPVDGTTIIRTVLTDIAERKQFEKERETARRDLEKNTAELLRANELLRKEIEEHRKAEELLRQAQKMEAVGTLAGGIAHDFNNMLTVIIGNAELALDEVDEEGARRNLRQILKASRRSRDLVKQILTFSRKSGGQDKPVKMAPLLKETYEMLRASLPRTIRMDLDIRTKSDTVVADPSLVQQVVLNLAGNAAYAMREAGGVLTIGLSSITLGSHSLTDEGMKPGGYLKLTVKDTGSGIAPDVQRRMFEPFFTTKELGHGTGMGLSVVYGIVKGYHGLIEVKSAVDKGSKFTVLLPQAEASSAIEEEQEEASSCSGKEHILFVDDEPAIVEMTKTMLERSGYHVTAVTDASEALKVFTANPGSFDLIITDQTMPDMTGIVLAEEVLAMDPDMPVIICTGYSETVSPEKAKEIGIREFETKPVTRDEMDRAIRRVLGQGRSFK